MASFRVDRDSAENETFFRRERILFPDESSSFVADRPRV